MQKLKTYNEHFLRLIYDFGDYLRKNYPRGLIKDIFIERTFPDRINGGIFYDDYLNYPRVSFDVLWKYANPVKSFPIFDDSKKLEDIDMDLPLEIYSTGEYTYKNEAIKLINDYDSRIRKIFEECCYEIMPVDQPGSFIPKNDVEIGHCKWPDLNLTFFHIKYEINRKKSSPKNRSNIF